MITVRIMGGLGNQMFQYAAGRRLAFYRRTELRLDLSSYRGGSDRRARGLESFARTELLSNFCITATEATPAELNRCRDRFISANPVHRAVRFVRRIKADFLRPQWHVREYNLAFDARLLELPDGSYIDGYWQSWKYFSDVSSLIRREFRLRDENLLQYAEKYLGRIRDIHGSVVSLHVRRGDLAHAVEVLGRQSIVKSEPVEPDYFHAAMRQFSPDTAFVVFSDSPNDIAWCRANIHGKNLFFSEGHSDIQDFILMGRCDHHITSNSTFSWWAAWLNASESRRVIVPHSWFLPGSKYENLQDDFLPRGWEIL